MTKQFDDFAETTTRSILIGGSGSTGSSLLRTIFNRHPIVFSGEELNFFNKRQYFVDWPNSRKSIMSRGPWTVSRTDGWFEYSGNALHHPDYLWSPREIERLVEDSQTLSIFATRFFERALQHHDKMIWLEKTPSNCYCFNEFLAAFEHGAVIHASRDPFESVCSLVRRGMTPYFACSLWLYNTCSALSAAQSSRYLLVRYEDLTENPQEETRRICEFLGLKYESSMLGKSSLDSDDHVANRGWRFKRNDAIAKPHPGFHELDKATRQEILTAMSVLRVSDGHATARNLGCVNFQEACEALGYALVLETTPPSCLSTLKRHHHLEVLRRTIRLSPTKAGNYPISFS